MDNQLLRCDGMKDKIVTVTLLRGNIGYITLHKEHRVIRIEENIWMFLNDYVLNLD
jgi:hypothetical protein